MEPTEYQKICARLARKAIRHAEQSSADESVTSTDVTCPKCSQPVGRDCRFVPSGHAVPHGFVHDVRAVAATAAQREHWIDVFLDGHLPDVDPEVVLEMTKHARAFEESTGRPAPSAEIAATHAFQADIWEAINQLTTAEIATRQTMQRDERNHQAPARDADGEPGNVSE